MIYKLTFSDDAVYYCAAKSQLHLLQSYDANFEFNIQEVEDVEEISEEQAKTIMVKNLDYTGEPGDSEEISVYDAAFLGDEDMFYVIASNEY